MTIAEYLEQQGLERGSRKAVRKDGKKRRSASLSLCCTAAFRATRRPVDRLTEQELTPGGLKLRISFTGDRQLALSGNRGMIQLIEGHKQRTHLAIQPLQQEAAHIFRHLEAAQSGAQLQRLQFVFIRQRLQLMICPSPAVRPDPAGQDSAAAAADRR